MLFAPTIEMLEQESWEIQYPVFILKVETTEFSNKFDVGNKGCQESFCDFQASCDCKPKANLVQLSLIEKGKAVRRTGLWGGWVGGGAKIQFQACKD